LGYTEEDLLLGQKEYGAWAHDLFDGDLTTAATPSAPRLLTSFMSFNPKT
jgi:hypothetical protein